MTEETVPTGIFDRVLHLIGQGCMGVFGLFMFGLFALLVKGCYDRVYPELEVRLAGQIQPGIIFDHAFQVQIWHQHPGTLHHGRIRVTVRGPAIESPDGYDWIERVHSFDQWSPNKEAVEIFDFPLKEVGDQVDLRVRVVITADEVQRYFTESHWQGNAWQ